MHRKRASEAEGKPRRFSSKLRKTHGHVPEKIDLQSLEVTSRDFVNKSQSK